MSSLAKVEEKIIGQIETNYEALSAVVPMSHNFIAPVHVHDAHASHCLDDETAVVELTCIEKKKNTIFETTADGDRVIPVGDDVIATGDACPRRHSTAVTGMEEEEEGEEEFCDAIDDLI